ncbi:MAG: hypothetical protein B7Z14_12950 [Bosea sp. 32-68-6]|nr:MAG: hypothetical protein B7Z14_12950 [Bosea sp. 32-68-6]
MRILLINPNTTAEVTALMAQVLAPMLPEGVTLKPVTGRFGARYIASRSAAAIAGHAALDAFAEQGGDCDAGLAGIETVAPTGAEIARDPDGAIALLTQACRDAAARDGAGAVILGGAGLAGLAARIAPHLDIPVICSVEAGLATVLAALRDPPPKPETGDLSAPAPIASIGLSERLAARLAEAGATPPS